MRPRRHTFVGLAVYLCATAALGQQPRGREFDHRFLVALPAQRVELQPAPPAGWIVAPIFATPRGEAGRLEAGAREWVVIAPARTEAGVLDNRSPWDQAHDIVD